MFIILILVIVLWVYIDVNIYHTIHFKCMFSIVYCVKNNTKVYDKYGQATDYLLYFMTRDSSVIELAEASVIMIMDDKKRELYNDIIYLVFEKGE